MPYYNRKWNVVDVADSKELAENLVKFASHCRCVGYRCDGILWLNDSPGGLIAPGQVDEWAIVREADGLQCESITVGWLDEEDDIKFVMMIHRKFSEGASPMFGESRSLQEHSLDHPDKCFLCM